MPHDEPDPEDPLELIGMMLPAPDEESVRDMAECFVEELYRLGHPPTSILEIFRDPGYQGPHLAWTTLGEDAIAKLVQAYRGLQAARSETMIRV